MTASIRFDNVSKWFTLYHGRSQTLQERILGLLHPRRNRLPSREQFWALRNASFTVEPGQTVGLVGSNGSGKSTALKLIARILEPTSGAITINGRVSALLELGAGFHPDLTGQENIYLNGSLMGLSRREMARCLDDIVEFSELEQFIDMPVKHYSSGMYMRLAFAVAIHVNPEILLVDEVLAVGDGGFQRKCLEHIGRLKREGVTILMVSHDLETVARLCNKAVWLDDGRVRQVGSGREVINAYIAQINEEQQAQMERRKRAQSRPEAPAPEEWAGESRGKEPALADGVAPAVPVALDAEITGVEVLGGTGAVTTSIATGDAMTIRVRYRANRRVERPTFGLGLHRDDEVHVAGPNTQVSGYEIEAIEGSGYIDYTVPRVPLMAGRYYISASLYDESCTHCYHYAHQLHSFLVQPRTVWDELGVVRLEARWRLVAGDAAVTDGVESLLAEHRMP